MESRVAETSVAAHRTVGLCSRGVRKMQPTGVPLQVRPGRVRKRAAHQVFQHSHAEAGNNLVERSQGAAPIRTIPLCGRRRLLARHNGGNRIVLGVCRPVRFARHQLFSAPLCNVWMWIAYFRVCDLAFVPGAAFRALPFLPTVADRSRPRRSAVWPACSRQAARVGHSPPGWVG